MVTGKVDAWLTSYGFIFGDDGNKYFVHVSALPQGMESLNSGQKVEFEVEQSDKGPRAKNVKLVSEAEAEEAPAEAAPEEPKAEEPAAEKAEESAAEEKPEAEEAAPEAESAPEEKAEAEEPAKEEPPEEEKKEE